MKEELYTKLIRIHVNNKIFDIFADQSHRKEFLEVKKKEEYEEYYYPMLKDYWFLNGIYNKPFDGILYSHKYSFKRGVFVGLLGFGGLVALYSTFQGTTPYKLQTNNPNIEVTTEIEDPTEYEKEINENYYTKIITQIEKLDEYGIHKVTIEDLRNSLSQNLSINSKYRAYIEEFIDCLEKKLPNADYRVFNDNLQRYVINNYFVSDRVEGNFDVYNGIINVKEKYLDKEGNEDLKTEKRVVFHELSHGLNHGLIISENERIYYSFSPSQFGDGFDEAYTTILADYLLSDDYKEYFSEVTRQYDSYGKTSETCYQALKILEESYTFEDYINNDIFYLEEKLQQNGLDDAVDIMDTYHLSIYEGESITIDEECEYSDLKDNIYKKGLEKSLEKEADLIKKLVLVNSCSDKIKIGNLNEIVTNIMSENSEDGMIKLIDPKETIRPTTVVTYKEGEMEEKEVMSEQPMIRITSPNKTETYSGYLMQIKVYRTYEDGETKYHFGHSDFETTKSFETGDVIDVDKIDIISLSEILPEANYEFETEILEDETFRKALEENFKSHEERINEKRKAQETQEQERLARKQKLSETVLPLIENAIAEGKTDLEINRIIIENVEDEKDIPIIGGMFSAIKPDYLLCLFDVVEVVGDEYIRVEDQGVHYKSILGNNGLIYATEEESGLKYHLGEFFFTDNKGEKRLIDIDGIETPLSECKNKKTIPLSEIIPEVEEYRFRMNKDFLNSKEFLDLIDGKIIESVSDDYQTSTTKHR